MENNTLILTITCLMCSLGLLQAQNAFQKADPETKGDKSSFKKIELTTPDSLTKINFSSGTNYQVEMATEPGTDIQVRMDIDSINPKANLSIHLQGKYLSENWQDGESYVFRTTDQSAHAYIEFITEPIGSGCSKSSITVTYYPIDNDDYWSHSEDELIYARRVIEANKNSFINEPISELFSFLESHELDIKSFTNTGDFNNKDYYNTINFMPVYGDYLIGYLGDEKDMWAIKIELAQEYHKDPILEIDRYVFNDLGYRGDSLSWNQYYKEEFSDKIIKDISVETY